eukprot:4598491-Pleurochrysis_carterae.AAC.1
MGGAAAATAAARLELEKLGVRQYEGRPAPIADAARHLPGRHSGAAGSGGVLTSVSAKMQAAMPAFEPAKGKLTFEPAKMCGVSARFLTRASKTNRYVAAAGRKAEKGTQGVGKAREAAKVLPKLVMKRVAD